MRPQTTRLTTPPTPPAHLSDSPGGHVLSNEVELPLTLQGDEVHTSHPAVVPGSEPVPPGVSQCGLVTVPGEPVGLSSRTFLVSHLTTTTTTSVRGRGRECTETTNYSHKPKSITECLKCRKMMDAPT